MAKTRLEKLDVLRSSGRIRKGEIAISLLRVIDVMEADAIAGTTFIKYSIEQQRNPNVLVDETKANIDDLMAKIDGDVGLPVTVLRRNRRPFGKELTLMASRIIYATERADGISTLILYEEDKASPPVQYVASGDLDAILKIFNELP